MRKHSTAIRRHPGAKWTVRGTVESEVKARVDRYSSGCDRFKEKRAKFVKDVVAIPKHMALANECFSEAGAKVMGEAMG